MTTAPALPARSPHGHSLHVSQHRGTRGEKSFPKARRDARAADSIFVQMLWAAFPAPSENNLAGRAAPVLGVSERQVKNWLRGNNDAKAAHFLALMERLGIQKTIEIAERVKRVSR